MTFNLTGYKATYDTRTFIARVWNSEGYHVATFRRYSGNQSWWACEWHRADLWGFNGSDLDRLLTLQGGA